jgi:hypothetical protein
MRFHAARVNRYRVGALRKSPDVRSAPIVLQNSQIVVRRFSRQSTKQPAIVDRYGAKLVSEVSGEFITM